MNIDQQAVANQCRPVVWNRVRIGIMRPGVPTSMTLNERER